MQTARHVQQPLSRNGMEHNLMNRPLSITAQSLLNSVPLLGASGGVVALAAIPQPEARLFTCAMMFAVAAGSALRRLFYATAVTHTNNARELPGDYPFDSRVAHPRERDGGPAGL